jgi:hypothetical protein
VERQMFFLVANQRGNHRPEKSCWVVKNCSPQRREKCPAWEFQSGKLCWFVSGTICDGEIQDNWEEKMKKCRSCDILKDVFDNLET